jgi:hypothetical protein
MTTQDRLDADAPVRAGGAPTAFFVPDGDGFVPTGLARGPWGQTISGNYVGGLLGYAVEHEARDPNFQPTRLTVDLLRPAALAPLRVETSVARQGRRLRLVDAVMTQSHEVVARASALFLRRGEQPADQAWTSPVAMPPVPPEPVDAPDDSPMVLWAYSEDSEVSAPSADLTGWQHGGPRWAWVYDHKRLVPGEPLTPFTRAALAGDVASSLTHFSAGGLNFINADYTLTLSRLPDGPFIGLASLTHYSHAGIAAGAATIFDRLGPIGNAVANALVNPGFAPPAFS